MKPTRERCIPEHMSNKIKTLQHHYARYNFALMYARNKHVLDAACGSGFGTNMMYDVANSVTGLDVSEEAIKYASNKYRGIFGVCDFDKEMINGDFDIVISFETIEHLSKPNFFIENIKKISKEFLFSIPIEDESEFHKTVWSIDEAVKMFNSHFDSVDFFSQKGLNITKGIGKSKYLIVYARI